jgi:hypothetical protein
MILEKKGGEGSGARRRDVKTDPFAGPVEEVLLQAMWFGW